MVRYKKLLAAVILTLSLLVSSVSHALDEDFYSGNNILFYDPDATSCSEATVDNAKTVVTSENLETFLRFYTDKGLSLAAAAGMAGNIQQESGFNPAIIQGGAQAGPNYTPVNGVGFGLAQWTFTSRQKPLMDFAKSQNKSITDLTVQLGFIWKEMANYPEMLTRLNAEKSDPVAAAVVFHGKTPNIESEGASAHPKYRQVNPPTGFEASADTSREVVEVRGGYAAAVYKKYQGKISDGAGIQPTTPDGSNTSAGSGVLCESETDELGVGKGKFTDSGEVTGFADVLYNSQEADKAYGNSLVGDGICAYIVARVWQDGISYGYNYATDLWYANKDRFGYKDRNPKKGAILLYLSSHPAGHVVIYLGNNKILNDGHIEDASIVETEWNAKYLGWVDPNDIGWKAKRTSNIKQAIGR